jgi:sugar phosphate isomerase/epimerase
MNKISRRSFLQRSTIVAGAGVAFSHLPASLFAQAKRSGIPLGFQTWSVKDKLGSDFAGTLKSMSDLGYTLLEMCSPEGYKNAGFGPLLKMKTPEMRKIIKDHGMSCPSCHFGLGELTDHLDERIAFAKDLGLSDMVCSSFGLPKTASLDDYMQAADKLNKAGEKIKAAGMQPGFHNHEMEFATLDGKLIYDELMNRFDANVIKMQFQTEVINLGYKASDYFRKYPGRFVSSHLSDWTADKKEVPVGQGVIDWKEFFAAAKQAGVKRFFVEMEPDKFKESASYISNMS